MAKRFATKLKRHIAKSQTSEIITGTVLSVDPLKISCHNGQWVPENVKGEEKAIEVARHIFLKKRKCCHAGCTAEGCTCHMDDCVCPVCQPLEVGDDVVLIGQNPFILIGVI